MKFIDFSLSPISTKVNQFAAFDWIFVEEQKLMLDFVGGMADNIK